jgi:hypothetical protein
MEFAINIHQAVGINSPSNIYPHFISYRGTPNEIPAKIEKMKSPFTGKEMKITSEKVKLTYRKEEFELSCKFYLCEGTGEKITTTELDEWNINLQRCKVVYLLLYCIKLTKWTNLIVKA